MSLPSVTNGLDYNVVELAKAHSSISGVLSGFSLTIAVLLLGRRNPDERNVTDSEERSIMLFFLSSIIALISAFTMGELSSESPLRGDIFPLRAFSALLPAASIFSLAVILLTLGISHALNFYNLKRIYGFSYWLHMTSVVMALTASVSASGALAEQLGHSKATFEILAYIFIVLSLLALGFKFGVAKRKPWFLRLASGLDRLGSDGSMHRFTWSFYLTIAGLMSLGSAYWVHEILSSAKNTLLSLSAIMTMTLIAYTVIFGSIFFLPTPDQDPASD